VGPLDEIQIYNRGLTPKKIFDLFTDKQLAGGFVSRWTSDDGRAKDSTGSNDGLLSEGVPKN
jgi:hypothetical protein